MVLAFAIVVSLLAGVGVHFATKAASTKTMIPFAKNSQDELVYEIPQDGMYVADGTYYYEYDNRVYTYNLTENLPAGTVLKFRENDKNIEWNNNFSYGKTNILSVPGVTAGETDPQTGNVTLNVDKANLSKNTQYYYQRSDDSFFVFQFQDDLTGKITQTVRGSSKDVQYTQGTLVLDFENETAELDGTRYELHYLYVESDELKSNDVYLIGVKPTENDATENIVAYNYTSTSSVPQTNYETPEGIMGAYTTVSLTAYPYDTSTQFVNASPAAGDDLTGGLPYYDGGAVRTSQANGKSQYLLGEFKAITSTDPTNNFYLKPVNHTSTNFEYYSDRAFGHIYTQDAPRNLYIHNYSTQRSRTNMGSWLSPNYQYYNNKYGSNWTYNGHQLINAQDSRNANYKYLAYNPSNQNMTRFVLSENSGDYVTLYKMALTPVPEAYSNPGSGETYANGTGAVAPTNVSYTENLTVEDNFLEMDKTVTRINDDTYKVHLEAYTTAPQIKQPVTDIVLVMDTSNKMATKLYDRDYKNLDTYTKFTAYSLNNITHDNLFDGDLNDEGSNWLVQAVRYLGSSVADVFGGRVYKGNRYVEDPNFPGTYVYLYQLYTSPNSLFGDNNYTYYFTSADGTEYATTTKTESLLDTARYLLGWGDGSIKTLTFYEDGNTANASLSISTIYKRDGTNMNNSLNRTVTIDDTTYIGLYERSISTGGLYIRDNDGEYKKVTVTPVDKDLNPVGVNRAVLYKYTVAGTDYVMYQGASQGGVQDSTHHPEYYGVYQGFRYYVPDPDNPNKLIIDEENSLLSKSLYTLAENTTVTRLQAMKEASEEFLLNVYRQSQKADINVGIVTYDAGATTRYKLGYLSDGTTPADLSNANHIDQMISDIYNLTANTNSKAATIDDGMANGQTEFQQRSAPDNRRFLLLFSGGVPADYTTFNYLFGRLDTSSGDYDTDVATNAIKTAYNLKNNMNTTIYSVGLFENADEAESSTYGHRYWYGLHPPTRCNNEIGNSWGRTGLANFIIENWTDLSIDPMDAAATNRLLGYISSDYATPQTIGLSRYSGGLGFWNRTNPGLDYYGNWYYLFSAGGAGYKVTNRYSKTDVNHYFGISPATVTEGEGSGEEGSDVTVVGTDPEIIIERFKTVFDTLIAETSVPSNELGPEAKLLDGITEYFKLKPETVDGFTMSTTDNGQNWSGHDTSTVTVVSYPDSNDPITADTKTLLASNHDYKQWYVNPNTGEGKKIVLEFEIERIPDLIGGNNIPTNLNNSGIYDGNPLNNPHLGVLGVLEEKFEVPKVDLSLIDIDTIGADQSAYYGCEADLQDMVNPKWINGKNNEFVNMTYTFLDANNNPVGGTYTVPAGYSEGTWSPEIDSPEDASARFLQMLQTSDYKVQLTVTPSTSGTVNERDDYTPGNAKVYVFTPQYDVHNDTVDEANDPYDLTSIPELGDWKLDKTTITTEDADELAAIEEEAYELLAFKQVPEVSYCLENVTSDTNPVTDSNKTAYPIPSKTVFEMVDIMVTPTPLPYTAKNAVTGYMLYTGSGDNKRLVGVETLDLDGNVVSTAWYDSDGNPTETAQSYSSREEILSDVTKYVYREDVDATAVTTVNNTDDHNTDKQFTINLKSHDVTIVNHTTGEESADYSDPNKEFPLTFTLKDENGDAVTNETITYIDANGQTQTKTTNSHGQFVIPMKDADTITLKEVQDGYTLTVTSDPSDLYDVLYLAGKTGETLVEIGSDEDEISDPVTINDAKTIDITHHIGDIPVTGFGAGDESTYGILIAILAVMAVSGGGYAVYRVYKPRKEEVH